MMQAPALAAWLCPPRRLLAGALFGALLVPLPWSLARAQMPTPVVVPENVIAPQREELRARRRTLLAEYSLLSGESRRHNVRCSAVTEGTAEDAACVAAQRRLLERMSRYRHEVARFASFVRYAPRQRPPDDLEREPPAVATNPEPVDPAKDVYFQSVRSTGEFYLLTPDGRRLSGAQATRVRLEYGSRIITGPNGRVQITLPDETVFTMGANAEFVLDEFIYEPAPPQPITVVKFISGTFRFVTGKIATWKPPDALPQETANQRFLRQHPWMVDMPIGGGGIRGTDVEVTVQRTRAGTIRVYEGAIDLFDRVTLRTLATVRAGQALSWDDSLRITALGPMPAGVAATGTRAASIGARTAAVRSGAVALAKQYGLLVAVVLLLALVSIHFLRTRRRA